MSSKRADRLRLGAVLALAAALAGCVPSVDAGRPPAPQPPVQSAPAPPPAPPRAPVRTDFALQGIAEQGAVMLKNDDWGRTSAEPRSPSGTKAARRRSNAACA